jgi:predicted nuclease of predicted toxin-antitoxin system
MRLKLDENLDVRLAPWLASMGHDVETVRSEVLSGAPDEEIFTVAAREERCLVTLDLDFSDPLRFSQ